MAKVDIISSFLVPMAKIDSNKFMSKMDLTPWDLQFLLLDPIQKGILFHKPHETQQFFQKSIIDHLKNTLSHTLSFFPPLAGRLATVEDDDNNTTSYFVDCNNVGAEFTHAVAGDVCVSDILEPNYIPEIVSSLFPLNGVSNFEGISKPLLGVQVTELVDGLFISCTANHAVIDGTSFWHFFNSWSEISRGLEEISKMPLFERWFPSNVNLNGGIIALPKLERNLLEKTVQPPPLLQRVFNFSKENVAKLKSVANSEAGSDKIISSLQAVSAHLWRSVTRCRRQNNQKLNDQQVQIMLMISARARIPLPDGYFGNAVYCAKTSTTVRDLVESGLEFAATKINHLVGEQNSEEAVKLVEDWVRNPIIHKKENFDFVISSSPRHNVYVNDFGWGKPIAVRSGGGQKVDGKMTLFPAAVDGGIDVEVCLAPETMRAVEVDAEFLEALSI